MIIGKDRHNPLSVNAPGMHATTIIIITSLYIMKVKTFINKARVTTMSCNPLSRQLRHLVRFNNIYILYHFSQLGTNITDAIFTCTHFKLGFLICPTCTFTCLRLSDK